MGSDMELCFNVRPFLALFTHSEVFLSLLEGLVLRPLFFDFPRSTMQTERLNDMQLYKDALEAGTVTEKERQLWEYVLSAYGTEEFTTKRLEKDFGNAAYTTIRAFVMKFASMGLLKARKAGNKVLYRTI